MAGATWKVVVLSSSPPEHAAASPLYIGSPRRVAMQPSSPLALSLPSSPQKIVAGASKINARAAPPPKGAVRGFATVGSLVRSEHFANQQDDAIADQPAQSRRASLESTREATTIATKKLQKRAAKKPADLAIDKPKPKSRARKRKTDKEDLLLHLEPQQLPSVNSPFFETGDSGLAFEPPSEPLKLTKSGKPRKPRTTKKKANTGEGDSVPSLINPRAAKPKVAKKGGKSQVEEPSTVSAHFQEALCDGADYDSVIDKTGLFQPAASHAAVDENALVRNVPQIPRPKTKAPPKQRPPDTSIDDLDLDEAVIRRRDWTPLRETMLPGPLTDSTDSTEKENGHVARDGDDTFTHLLSDFTYASSPSKKNFGRAARLTGEGMAALKRRRVELVEVPSKDANSRNSSPEKAKAPKKKPRTITGLVTEQYAPKDSNLDPPAVKSDFLEPQAAATRTTKILLNDISTPNAGARAKKPRLKRTSSKSDVETTARKPKSPKTSSKAAAKSKAVGEKLHSPTSAVLRLSRQDVLFGTSSQLALEDSPTAVRQLQRAITESEQDANISGYLPDSPPHWPGLKRTKGNKSLWNISARDSGGGFLEHLKDVYIPEPDHTQDFRLLMDGARDQPAAGEVLVDIDDFDPVSVVIISSEPPTPPRDVDPPSKIKTSIPDDFPIPNAIFEDIDSFGQEPPPSNQNAESQNSFTDIDDLLFPPSAQMQIALVSQSRLGGTPACERSPEKRSNCPPKSKSAISTITAASTTTLKHSATNLQSKEKILHPLLTPPKASCRFIDIEEILDSEDEFLEALSPTPPRIRRLDSVPLSLVSLDPSPLKSTIQYAVNASLTPVLRISTSHLEWANIKTTAFTTITAHIRSIPPTTDPKQPSWHEKILMYDPLVLEDFTAYLNGNTNVRAYKKATKKQIKAWNAQLKASGRAILSVGPSGDEILAIEKELDANMVQGWCQEMSVCCIWGEGRGKGGARKGLY